MFGVVAVTRQQAVPSEAISPATGDCEQGKETEATLLELLLWALPTRRAAECVALNPTESAAKDGRCLYGKPRGEGEGLF